MPETTSETVAVKSCGKAHAWCAECQPAQATARRRPPRPRKVHTKPCRNCGRCDACLGIVTAGGLKLCRKCNATKPIGEFGKRADTGGVRNQCNRCRNGAQKNKPCESCGRLFFTVTPGRTLCPGCRPPLQKDCKACGAAFIGSMDQRLYCSKACATSVIPALRSATYKALRLEALRAYGGEHPACKCCGEDNPGFLALDHINGGGRRHRQETGGGGYWTWLRKNGYPDGFRVLCHNCNMGREYSGSGICPHEMRPRMIA